MGVLKLTRRVVIEELVCDARKAIERVDTKRGFSAGDRLVALHDPRGHQILAELYASLGAKREMFDALQRGTRAHPEDWRLWAMLADRLAEHGDHARAVEAYDSALAQVGVKRPALAIARAKSLSAMGLHEHALTSLEREPTPTNGDAYVEMEQLAIALLCEMDRFDEACERAADLVERHSMSASRYRVKLRGRVAAPVAQGQSRSARVGVYVVVADDEAEAFALAVRCEPSVVRPTMSLVECDRIEQAAGNPKGVETVLASFEVPTPSTRMLGRSASTSANDHAVA